MQNPRPDTRPLGVNCSLQRAGKGGPQCTDTSGSATRGSSSSTSAVIPSPAEGPEEQERLRYQEGGRARPP
jgi:hypothetical protein